ncbi:UNVERIFIED_CONTAM: SNF2 domain-containing protein CLASSY 2 [Sesamum latifolium]|uniref:SNF2 domain-containing protein CLASSY 2 n=1 Tax=Sesamum latifolium TaxID=2727402 RepID=A0AAW2TC04_9LAMI
MESRHPSRRFSAFPETPSARPRVAPNDLFCFRPLPLFPVPMQKSVLVLIMVVLGLKSVIKNEILSEFGNSGSAFECFSVPASPFLECFFWPGVDVCVLSASQNSENTDDERNAEPVWIDAKLRSIERKPHDVTCDCNFYVSFYLEQGPDLILANKKLSKETSMIKIDQISVLQRLELKPCDSEYYRWSFSEDCSSVQKFKLFTGKFCADLTWLIVTSVLKKTAFDIRSIRNHIVYEFAPDTLQEGPEGREVGFLSSFDPMELRRSKRRIVQPERYLGCDNLPDYEIEVTRLGESKTYKLEYDETSSDSDEYDEMPLALSVQADNQYQQYGGAEEWIRSYKKSNSRSNLGSAVLKHKSHKKSGSSKHPQKKSGALDKGPQGNELAIVPANTSAENSLDFFDKKFRNVKIPEDYSEDIGDMVESGSRRGPKGTRRKYHRRSSLSASLKRDCVYIRESIYDVRSFRKGSVTAQLCRELIRRCMNNIDATLKNEPIQPPVVDQWKEFQSTTSSNKGNWMRNPQRTMKKKISEIDMLWKEMELALASWYLFDDNEDSHVQPAAEVPKPRENVENKCEHDSDSMNKLELFADYTASSHSIPNKEQRTEDEPELKKSEDGELDQFCIPAPSSTPSTIGEGQNNVWALIPDLKDKLRSHQKRAFEFLWRNIAGSLIPSRMEKKKKRRGSRPLVLAPKTTLYTWYKEIIKWKVPIPVYQIHGGQTYKGEVLKQRMKLAPGLPRNQDVMHVLDCLEKMQRWLSHPSILLMGYTSFLTLTREDSHYAHRKYMAQLLKQCPGILILDEGHNPRSTKSRLRKALMKVNTRLRVLLSGTLFQNNFGEYFNTLCLARPVFVNEVLKELDPKYEKRNKERQTQFSLENRGRKLLIDKISKRIDSNKGEERAQALKTLKKLTINQSSARNSVKTSESKACLQGISTGVGVINHTWGNPSLVDQNNGMLHQIRDEPHTTMSDQKRKVLIFCHNIAPINLFLQIFERFYGWRKGREVLVLQGDIELFERGRVMDKFEEPGGPSKVMLASITACAEGISLTAASRVILLDSEWNPSKSKQAIARAFRPGQNKVVYVYQLLATGTLEEEKHSRTTWKEWVSDMIFSDEHVEDPSHWQAPKIEDELLRRLSKKIVLRFSIGS